MQRTPADFLRQLPGYVLRRASATMMGKLAERLTPLGLRHLEATILLVLAERPGMSQSALGRQLAIKRANMTPLAARLEERGLIQRSASDGRSFGLQLTTAGHVLADKVRAAVDSHERALLQRVPEEHRAHLLPALLALWDDPEGP